MKRFDTINVIPFIDIMLVLLAIVLTTASFIAQGKISIALPVAKTANSAADISAMEISIDHKRNIFINDKAISIAELQSQLENEDRLKPVILRVDASVAFESFVEVVDILKQEKFNQLTIKTRRMP